LIPAAILGRKMGKQHSRAVVYYLVMWEGHAKSETTWEDVATMEERFPQFLRNSRPEGKS